MSLLVRLHASARFPSLSISPWAAKFAAWQAIIASFANNAAPYCYSPHAPTTRSFFQVTSQPQLKWRTSSSSARFVSQCGVWSSSKSFSDVASDNSLCLFVVCHVLQWSYKELNIDDLTLEDFIAIKDKDHVFIPHTAGRYQIKRFRKAQCPAVERLANALMRKGRNNGKKMLAMRIIQQAFEIIHLMTDDNPLQVFVRAIVNAGPREDSTRVGSGGIVRRQAVDVSPFRRVNQALYLMAMGAREASFRTIKTASECLADEIVNASKGSSK